ncbi:aromatic amino acid lyase [Microvenator marinus]|jgi:histidine ammonia-lyase|uniref:Aromatic amino acid lyase n=1 Tax=Microvenator marinus TaxID=2600177 RepID=A0A5B8XS52_9DELT|nr:aromatic amino acid ammonia-lyase [Microvenator marinus]QED28384.1 aromatic amino acid lyase [Microvenator marinus]
MKSVVFGSTPLTVEDIVGVAQGRFTPKLNVDPSFRKEIDHSRRKFEGLVGQDARVYGVTTGFGENIRMTIGSSEASNLAQNLIRFHGCGTGDIFGEHEAAAITACRLQSLCSPYSAVRWELLEQVLWMLQNRVLPAIPVEGSVGASGDLTPLSYLAASVAGTREVLWKSALHPTEEVFAELGRTPLDIGPKESLAIMNGTSAMTGVATLVIHRARRLSELAAYLSAVLSDVTDANSAHFDPRLHSSKPHAGQILAAERMARWLCYDPGRHVDPEQLQSVYSIRCAPHVIGVLSDTLKPATLWVETELNGSSDNPLFDAEMGVVLHGGNFYGGHVAMAMDMLKTSIASVADLMDRQMQLLCGPVVANGSHLPRNLVPPDHHEGGDARHGFKAMSIATSALAAEALKLTMPATAFSRSTESHNQDKVSMGTIAARDASRVMQLTERVAAILIIALAQAVDLRPPAATQKASRAFRDLIREDIDFADNDRRFDGDIRTVVGRLEASLVEDLRRLER